MSFGSRASAACLLIATSCTTIHTLPASRRTVSVRYVNASFARFERQAVNITFRRTPPVEAAYQRSVTAVATLRVIANRSRMRRITVRYARSLDYDLRTVEEKAVRVTPTPAELEALSNAVISLETKAGYAIANEDTWADLIEVTVETMRGKEPISGLEVWYCSRGWAESKPHWYRFSALSTPTTERLPPGIYLVAAGAPNIDAVPMRVGLNGQRKIYFVLHVP
jgi:hypothetical protein